MDWWAALGMTYLWLKAGHVVFVIFWMAGLFLLPRYYIYHQESPPGSEEERRWVDRETKLRRIILTPAMIAVWGFGLVLASTGQWWSAGWLHLKLLAVLALTAYHGYMVGYGKKLARGHRPVSGTALRIMNEVPGVAAVVIVILVVVKPL